MDFERPKDSADLAAKYADAVLSHERAYQQLLLLDARRKSVRSVEKEICRDEFANRGEKCSEARLDDYVMTRGVMGELLSEEHELRTSIPELKAARSYYGALMKIAEGSSDESEG